VLSVKDLRFVGGSLVDLRRFPTEARREAGLRRVLRRRGPLHCFEKKSRKTRKEDLDLAR
jgi:phage-related protein